jgi:hypothetical protein
MKQLLTFGAVLALTVALMNLPQLGKAPSGLTVVKGGAAFAADLGRPPPYAPPPPPPVGKGKAPVVGKGKAPILAKG